jgi:hypothetical protein
VLKFTRVQLPHSGEIIPFVALRREAVVLIEPTLSEDMVETVGSTGRTSPRDVICLVAAGQVRGTLQVASTSGSRTSVRQQANLTVLRHCLFVSYGEAEDSVKVRRLGVVVVNLSAAIGVAERDWPE